MRSRSAVVLAALSLSALAACGGAPAPTAPSPAPSAIAPAPPDPQLPGRLVGQVSGDGAFAHLQKLQQIADENGGNRSLGTPGYDASVDYVADVLRKAGYQVQTPEFTARKFTPGEQRLTIDGQPVPATVLGFSPATPAGGITAPLAPVDGDGCDRAALAGVPRGAVLMVRRGTCTFADKAANAAAAGAAALLVVNNSDQPLTQATLGESATGVVPTTGLSRAVGDPLFARSGAKVNLLLNTTVTEARSRNVIAQTGTGNPDATVVAGAHLDSVADGPGINDDGSGVAALLEVATRLGAAPPVANAVRFAFWGAEEEGLVGSTSYLTGLSQEERKRIALYLNLDMIASPDSGYYVYDGDDSDKQGNGPGPPGSAVIEKVLLEGLAATGVQGAGTDFDGRSDYGPFVEAGVPSGGLFTGAEEPIPPEYAQRWNLSPGKPHDPCYHQKCDRIEAINKPALDRNTDVVAAAIARFALNLDGIPKR